MLLVVITWLLAPWIGFRRLIFRSKPVERILLVQTAKIGDVVCATPVMNAVRAAYPAAFFAVLLSPGCVEIIKNNQKVDEIMVTPKGGFRGIVSKIRFIHKLYHRQFDLVIGLNPSLPLWLLPVMAGIGLNAAIFPPSMGRTLRLASFWIQKHETHHVTQLQLETVRQLLSQLNIELDSFAKTLTSTPLGEQKAEALLSTARGEVIGIGIASANRLKELSVDFLIAVIGALVKMGHSVVMIGSASDQAKADEISRAMSDHLPQHIASLFSACGLFTLDELYALLTRLNCYIGVDSGITYCMDATDVPIVVITGPTESAEQRPTQVPAIFLKPADLACCPCTFVYQTRSVCANKETPYACIRQITVEKVLASVCHLLAKKF